MFLSTSPKETPSGLRNTILYVLGTALPRRMITLEYIAVGRLVCPGIEGLSRMIQATHKEPERPAIMAIQSGFLDFRVSYGSPDIVRQISIHREMGGLCVFCSKEGRKQGMGRNQSFPVP